MTDAVPLFPNVATAEQIRDYCEWHVQNGRGRHLLIVDRRGLDYLKPHQHETVGVGIPPSEETFDPATGRVFVRVVF